MKLLPAVSTTSTRPVRGRSWRAASVMLGTSVLVVVAIIALVELEPRLSLSLRDPLAVARAGDDVGAAYVGWASNAGVALWLLAAGAAGLGATVAVRHRDLPLTRYLGGAALLSLVFGADDLFMIHEDLGLRFLNLGEAAVAAVWLLLAAGWAALCRRDLLGDRDLPTAVLAAALLLASEMVDELQIVFGGLEEALKFAGIVCWFAFVWRVASRHLLEGQQSRWSTSPRSRP